ncbi:MAG: ribosomal RNA small subunit methyltransferase A [Candidatus Niyogibacteria bacterium CG10_big_fil_rev_8_21_14_0_10_42_19]|uniref:Ribosomal RNA small subunit methyltransferase A n=1 Tax=Candidatus Niyogibacteria bacterium CG10_big_fil_rev_8_21_14_0_10_42_19 TaxID=1974725 RepID=A0A2H0TFI6_9BACT|nr:MAG: ribosomal RNA small subunit methyltransferase A [Candidatus Niyogibacteria bacterium CG10_big_fil_rev_8_21_14_0_10_42_19]
MGTKLGQNFLISKAIARRIAKEAGIEPEDVVLEVGPGKGILTDALFKYAPKKIIAIEKDKYLASALKEKYDSFKNVEILEGDVLDYLEEDPRPREFKIVANIPYYLTSRMLRLIFSSGAPKTLPLKVVLMMQKEVAGRVAAKPPQMSLLSVSVQVFGKTRVAFRVPKKYFKPKPKVDSAVLLIEDISRDFFTGISEKDFFYLVKAGFTQKRKFLISNLKNYLWRPDPLSLDSAGFIAPKPNFGDARAGGVAEIKKTDLEEIFKECGVSLKARAQDVSIDNWKNLLYHLSQR